MLLSVQSAEASAESVSCFQTGCVQETVTIRPFVGIQQNSASQSV